MANKTDIANLALTMLGAEQIASINGKSESANKIRIVYDSVRNAIFEEHPWNFASNEVRLAPVVDRPLRGFAYQYNKPADCVRVNNIYDKDGNELPPEEFTVTGDKIQCNYNSIIISYNTLITDESLFSSLFVQAFATRIAFEICYGLTGSRTLMSDLWALYQQKLQIGKTANAKEDPYKDLDKFSDPWIDARF